MPKRKIIWGDLIRRRVEAGQSGFLARTSLDATVAPEVAFLIETAAREPVDLVVVDGASTSLPAVSVCRQLRRDERTRSITLLAVALDPAQAEILRRAGCDEVLPADIEPAALQQRIAHTLGMRLRRHRRYNVVLPVGRGRLIHEFLGYSKSLSEGGMGLETSVSLRGGDHLPLRLYRNTEESPILVLGRICSVRSNIDTGTGLAVGVEFCRLDINDRRRILELFPGEPRRRAGAGLGDTNPGFSA